MPLAAPPVPRGTDRLSPGLRDKDHYLGDAEVLSDYEDLLVDGDMDDDILILPLLHAGRTPPPLPPRSQKRVSRLLGNVMIELKSLDGSPVEKRASPDPHEWYLSSEEDGSLSGDNDDDLESLVELGPPSSEPGALPPRSSSLDSQTSPVRAISFRPAGKPRIIDIRVRSRPARKQSLASYNGLPAGSSFSDLWEPVPAPGPPALPPRGPASMKSTATEPVPRSSQPSRREARSGSLSLRKTSRLSFSTSPFTTVSAHPFPNSDHYPQGETNEFSLEDSSANWHQLLKPLPSPPPPQTPKTPKTPSSHHTRALSKSHRPAIHRISHSHSHSHHRVASRPGLAAVAEEHHADVPAWNHLRRSATSPQTRHEWPVARPWHPSSAKDQSMRPGVKGIQRRKGVKGRSERHPA
jgi:hypothetical protein